MTFSSGDYSFVWEQATPAPTSTPSHDPVLLEFENVGPSASIVCFDADDDLDANNWILFFRQGFTYEDALKWDHITTE